MLVYTYDPVLSLLTDGGQSAPLRGPVPDYAICPALVMSADQDDFYVLPEVSPPNQLPASSGYSAYYTKTAPSQPSGPPAQGDAYRLAPVLSSNQYHAPPVTNRPAAPSAPPVPSFLKRFFASAKGRENVKVQDRFGRERSMRPLQHDTYDTESKQDGGTVDYFTAQARKQYQVSIDAVMRWSVSGIAVDTKPIYDNAISAHPGKVGAATFGRSKRTGAILGPPPGYAGHALIWVCAPGENGNATFYSNACIIHQLHHSSFSVDKKVMGGGEWVIENGRLKFVSPNSGHFRPDLSTFYNVVLHMTRAFSADTRIVMYDSTVDQYVGRKVQDFISKPSDNGRFKVHVDAV